MYASNDMKRILICLKLSNVRKIIILISNQLRSMSHKSFSFARMNNRFLPKLKTRVENLYYFYSYFCSYFYSYYWLYIYIFIRYIYNYIALVKVEN